MDIVFRSCVPDEQAVKSGCRSEAATHVVEFQSLDAATEVADPLLPSFELLNDIFENLIDLKRVNTTSGWL